MPQQAPTGGAAASLVAPRYGGVFVRSRCTMEAPVLKYDIAERATQLNVALSPLELRGLVEYTDRFHGSGTGAGVITREAFVDVPCKDRMPTASQLPPLARC